VNILVDVVCSGCKMKTKCSLKRPGAIGFEVFRFRCSSCESENMARVRRARKDSLKSQKPGEKQQIVVETYTKVIKASPLLIEMLKQEAEEKQMTAAEKDAQLAREEEDAVQRGDLDRGVPAGSPDNEALGRV
jgi:hypothetical protein